MRRAVWTGAVSFGLVSIPVALYPATSPKDVRFHLFDRQGRRVRYRRVAEDRDDERGYQLEPTGQPVRPDEPEALSEAVGATPDSRTSPTGCETERNGELAFSDLVRGYEVEPGRFAMLEPKEIEATRPERSATIELEDFVELHDIDPVYFEKTYHVAPRGGAAKPYRLLQRTLDRTHRVGIGRFVLRTKPHLVAVRATSETFVLETLYFGDEVRSASEVVQIADETVTDRELLLAEQLVEIYATAWDPDRYADDYREGLLRIIAEKIPAASSDTKDREEPTTTPRVEELMAALKRSVEDAKASRGTATRHVG